MIIAVLCETSNKVSQAFRNKGHEVWSFDILKNDVDQEHHIETDLNDMFLARDLWRNYWKQFDMVIGHPPCTYLCNSGVKWLYKDRPSETKEERRRKMMDAVTFWYNMWDLPVKKMVLENPISHKYALGKFYDQIIQPWQHGHGETKATGLKVRGLPLLEPSNIVEGREGRLHKLPPSKDRGKIRSETYQGIADAMADQWG
jgi:hypothetical protein